MAKATNPHAAAQRHLTRSGPEMAALIRRVGPCTLVPHTDLFSVLVRTVIAHEPPLDRLLPDADELLAKSEKLMADYLAGDVTGAWKQFFAVANIQLPDEEPLLHYCDRQDVLVWPLVPFVAARVFRPRRRKP